MSASFLQAALARAQDEAGSASAADGDGMAHFVVGAETVALSIARSHIPHNCVLAALVRKRPNESLPLPACDARFFELILQFYADEHPPSPFAACHHRVLISHPAAGQLNTNATEVRRWYEALRQTRVTFFTREGYHEGSAVAPDSAGLDRAEPMPAAVFELRTAAPTVLNEVRVRAVEWDPLPSDVDDSDGAEETAFHAEEIAFHQRRRLVPPFVAIGLTSPSELLVQHNGTSTDMEARALVLRNAPRRRVVRGDTLSALLALPRDVCWHEADFHGCSDLTLSLGRAMLEERSKLKAFLAPPRDGGGPRRLKAWPGKDAVQAMAAWWLAARLVDAHAYTECELYAVIEAECAYPPDCGTIRKELVRRSCLGQPSITVNVDQTTSTLYRLDASGMRRLLEGEWRAKGVL